MRKKVETLIVVGLNDQNVSTYLPEDSSSGLSETVAASSEEDELDLIASVIESDMAGTKIKKIRPQKHLARFNSIFINAKSDFKRNCHSKNQQEPDIKRNKFSAIYSAPQFFSVHNLPYWCALYK